MAISKEDILINLKQVLSTKNFSFSVKHKIKNLLLTIAELDIEDNQEQIPAIINGLKSIDTFLIDKRDKLIKNKMVGNELKEYVGGYIKIDSKLAVIVKEFQDQSTLYHELVHLTQNNDSYQINSRRYSFPVLFKMAMKEGEAIYYQHKFQQKQFPSELNSLCIWYLSDFYKICFELYQDMKNVLGSELLQKWKNVDENQDIMIEIEKYVQEKYNTSFSNLYNTWAGILYYFASRDENAQKIAENDFEHQQKLYKLNTDRLDNFQQLLTNEKGYLENLKKLLVAIDNIINNRELLSASYQEFLKSGQKEITIESYKENLIEKKKQAIEEVSHCTKELSEDLAEYENLGWYRTFCKPDITSLDLHSLSILRSNILREYNPSFDKQISVIAIFDYFDQKEMDKNK